MGRPAPTPTREALVLRQVLLQVARSTRVRDLVEATPVARGVVRRYVAGTQPFDAVRACADLVSTGRTATLGHLGEDTTDLASARARPDPNPQGLRALSDADGGRVEVSVKLSAVGQALGADGEKIALEHAHDICVAAAQSQTTVTLDMEDHTTTDATLNVLRELRQDYPWVGAVLQSHLRRTEGDCADLSGPGSRVRLCKGAYNEPVAVAFRGNDVDLSFVRCLKILMAGGGYPMVATHDPRLIDLAGALAARHRRAPGSYEFQMLYGVRPVEQQRLADLGETVRVYVPYGTEWYGYLVRRLAERPANLAFFLRSMASGR
jgi:proline dehydrogenase